MFPLLAILSQWHSTTHSSSSKRPCLLVILWFWCPRRLDETVGCANVENCVTLWSVSSRTCQVTTSFRLHGQLNYDLCTPAVNMMFSLAVNAMRSPSCSPPARSYHFCLERITSLFAAEAGPLFASVNRRLIVDNRN